MAFGKVNITSLSPFLHLERSGDDYTTQGLPWWLSGYRIRLQYRGLRFNPWVGKMPWRRAWQLTPVFLPGELHGPRSLVGYSPQGHKESDTTD